MEPEEEENKVPFTLDFSLSPEAGERTYTPFPLSRDPSTLPAVPREVEETATPVINVNQIVEEYGRPLLKEDFLQDERLQELVYQGLERRRGGTNVAGRVATGVAGGATFGTRDYRSQPFEDVFETWQNWQRSFDAGQSVTTANEIAFTLGEDEETAAILGANYLAFDAMDNAITGAGTWSETADAIADYTRAVIWDPATLLTFGIGKALSGATTRASAAATRNVMIRAHRRALSRNVAGRAALSTIGNAARAAPYIAPDLAFNVGSDVAQQFQLIRTGAQEEYSATRTGLAAAGTMVIPALMYGMKKVGDLRRGALRDTALGAPEFEYLTREVSEDTAWEMSMQRVNRDQLIDAVDENFGRIQGDPDKFLEWENAKIVAGEIVGENGERLTDDRLMNMFERYFWFGNPNETSTGYFNALKDSGFIVHPSMLENNTYSGVFGQAITFLTDESAERIVRQFEEVTGRSLGIEPTADNLAAHFISRSNTMGEGLGIRSQLSRLERQGLTGRQLMENAAGVGQIEDSPDAFRFGMSVYKRLLTSHLSTTGANLKGFSQLVSLNTLADLFSASIYATQRGVAAFAGNADEAARYARLSRASLRSPARRIAGALSPDLDIEYATLVLEQNPEIMERLFRDLAGDSGPNQALSQFNLEGSGVARTVDNVTRGAQTLTLVQLQDDLTKRWAFASNLDREIDRTYGMTAAEFWRRDDAAIEQASEQFQEVLNRAVYRTQRETASVNWSSLPANNFLRTTAAAFEDGVNRKYFGGAGQFIVPFAGFMNTTIATVSDLSGASAALRILGVGRELDYASQDFGELMGKAIAGWATVATVEVPNAVARLQSGLAWNQDENDFGEIQDRAFDWPDSTMRLMGQIVAHTLVGENIPSDPLELSQALQDGSVTFDVSQVPADLVRELGIQAGPGQAIRDFDGALMTARDMLNSVLEGEASSDDYVGFAMALLAKPIQAVTRPLDPINLAVGIARDGNMNPDLRQGPEFVNQALRYVNQLVPSVSNVDELPRRATPLRGTESRVDIGRQILGNRTTDTPNLAESMHNSAGIPSWRAIRWDGPPEVKNFMDGLAAPIFERESLRALQSNPDYFDMNTEQKQRILESVRGRVRESVMDIMQTRGIPRTLDAARRLSGSDQTKVNRVINFLGYEGSISDILQQEDAFDALNRIQYFVDNYDAIFYGDLELE